MPCPLLIAGPTTEPTLMWKSCSVPGCSYIDPAPFYPGSKAVFNTHQRGNVVTAGVRRDDHIDSVVWDASTGRERFAVRGAPGECVPHGFIPFTVGNEDHAWSGVTNSAKTPSDDIYYEVVLDTLAATKLDIPPGMGAQRIAGDADHLALENIVGPTLGVYARGTGTFHYLDPQMSFRPRASGIPSLAP